MKIELYPLVRDIDGDTYSFCIPAKSLKDAEEIASKIGATCVGVGGVYEVSAIPVYALMEFCSEIADESIRWKVNAEEQLQAFLSIGWKKGEAR